MNRLNVTALISIYPDMLHSDVVNDCYTQHCETDFNKNLPLRIDYTVPIQLCCAHSFQPIYLTQEASIFKVIHVPMTQCTRKQH